MKLYEVKGTYKQGLSEEEAVKLLPKCSDALHFTDAPIVRGMTGFADFYLLRGEYGKRKSVNTNNIYTLILSAVLGKKGYPKRSASIICTNYENRDYVDVYGITYMILPFNGVGIGVCPEYDMFFTEITLFGKQYEIHKLNRYFEDLFDFLHLELRENATYYQFIQLLKKAIAHKDFLKFRDHEVFAGFTVENAQNIIEQAYGTANFNLTTTATPEFFNDGTDHELWIGGPCLAVKYDKFKQFVNTHQQIRTSKNENNI